jgi:hypothetical protein
VTHGHKVRLDDSISMFVGLDVHKKQLRLMERECSSRSTGIPNDVCEIERFFADICDARIVIESSSSWFQFYELLSKRYWVVLSNPPPAQSKIEIQAGHTFSYDCAIA